ncbi:hypothetical protein COU17_02690 [Candidatus Kaiserbacteria bacterium CG10_big_fil_rev_8_21_14_0_10_49_17]|uniref:CxxC-x17-CxxC domain-containing protein n=1 Tax=Candidatus Kaiserbacteria bacterium CG10_big_fil_rev_8_21_14_0_10_49_17 TaxID=1974609 RepID=A0A2M6WE19_9BACT|nr:MAG: hypothetical protein COU17_02690 [Candidatus Kaiserbacteria bacterium CG10_big_fil_rev_8_21_14_0_10_49_17]
MHQGNWTCSGCGAAITQLPFEPRDTSNLKCLDCFKKGKGNSAPAGERKTFKGDWKCSGCGTAITELPFEPRSTENLKCRECFRAN